MTLASYLNVIGSILIGLSFFSENRAKLLNVVISKYLNNVSKRIEVDFKKSGKILVSRIIPLIIFILMIIIAYLFIKLSKYIPDTTTYLLVVKMILVLLFFSVFAFSLISILNYIFNPEVIVNVFIGGAIIAIIKLLNKLSSVTGVIGVLLSILSVYMQTK